MNENETKNKTVWKVVEQMLIAKFILVPLLFIARIIILSEFLHALPPGSV